MNIFLVLSVLLVNIHFSFSINKYWVGKNNYQWSNPLNWSLTSGGNPGTTSPMAIDEVYFDENGNIDCLIDDNIEIAGFHILNNYSSTIQQSTGYSITIGEGNYTQYNGTFIGGNSTIEINGSFNLFEGIFCSTSSTLVIGKKDYSNLSTTIFNHSGGQFLHQHGTVNFQPIGAEDIEFTINTLPNDRFHNLYIDVNGENSNTQLLLSSEDTLYVQNELTLYDGRINNGHLCVEGNVLIHYSFTSGTTPLHFIGSKEQTLDLTGAESKINSTVYFDKKEHNVTLLSTCKFDDYGQKIYFNSGNLVSTNTDLIIFGNNVEVLHSSKKSFVNGPVRKLGNDTFTFPIGKNDSTYAPISISAPRNVTNQFTAEYFQDSPSNSTDKFSKDGSIDHISNCEYWLLDQTSGDSEVEVHLSWENRSCGIENLTDLVITNWNGSQWENLGGINTVGNISEGALSSTNKVSSFGMFTLASITISSPLPIELMSFSARVLGNNVEVNWETISEKNNAFFTIERSTDTINWTQIKVIGAAGNSNAPLQYQIIDEPLLRGTYYYKLKQTDYNGTSTYSKIVPVKMEDSDPVLLKIYPNPLKRGKHNFLHINPSILERYLVTIHSILGITIYESYVDDFENTFKLNISFFNNVPSGVYLINITSNNQVTTTSLIID